MNFPFYQSHEGVVGMSDSRHKWERLQVPEDLTGRTVLDIGCNEGLITSWLAQRNAEKVIGIDFDKPRIEYARLTYPAPNISFLCQSWSPLPDGRFDLVLWTSAMHYEKDPKSVLQNIWRQLKPDGLLILECGYVGSSGREMIPVTRHSDTATPGFIRRRSVWSRSCWKILPFGR
jgi:2-polyprenyl-3-methyl-5-hydroxy-6-metoxy-1,4-benzoquinol methylase